MYTCECVGYTGTACLQCSVHEAQVSRVLEATRHQANALSCAALPCASLQTTVTLSSNLLNAIQNSIGSVQILSSCLHALSSAKDTQLAETPDDERNEHY